ncbi:helix-turn-helix domain-containing protein [Cytophagales bacterium LB-30]|uniref:Helix-turn-helix domain-containing protein n=1 Tax=Shiella aurantiaca TaxID=3058365 RepID=A0ABT8F3S6_9BACT|nr:helix-turn-helix domain-containing protein [Shiella aurantiaca]MDN4165106.1 helix-turn-helix domain-containing protein [Shiella aurantiaca]
MTLGQQISLKRKSRGLSQEVLAEESGISLRTIQRIENDLSQPRPHTLKTLADTLHIALSDLSVNPSQEASVKSVVALQAINSSALLGVFIPLFQVIGPFFLWRKHKSDPLEYQTGKKILSFQILWLLLTGLILPITHFMHYAITGQFVLGKIPFVLVIYLILVAGNAAWVIKNAILLKKQNLDIYPFIPVLF